MSRDETTLADIARAAQLVVLFAKGMTASVFARMASLSHAPRYRGVALCTHPVVT